MAGTKGKTRNTAVFETSHQLTERENDNYELHIRTSLQTAFKTSTGI